MGSRCGISRIGYDFFDEKLDEKKEMLTKKNVSIFSKIRRNTDQKVVV